MLNLISQLKQRDNAMKNASLVWLGHSTFQITTPSGKVVLVDPFLSGNPQLSEELKTPSQVDAIFLTHGHEDHVGDTLDLASRFDCPVYGIVELVGVLQSHGLKREQAVGFNKGGTVHFDDVSVTMVHAQHSSSFRGEYAGEATGLVFRVHKAWTFYHMGDTNAFADMELIAEVHEPDVVAVPIGDHYTMGHVEGALAVELVEPTIAVPCHYGTFPVLTGDAAEFKRLVERDTQTNVQILGVGEAVVL